MADLRELLAAAGFTDIRTHLNSGNVILSAPSVPGKVIEKARSQIRSEAVEQQNALAKRDRELHAREEALTRTVEERVLAARAELTAQAENAARLQHGFIVGER